LNLLKYVKIFTGWIDKGYKKAERSGVIYSKSY